MEKLQSHQEATSFALLRAQFAQSWSKLAEAPASQAGKSALIIFVWYSIFMLDTLTTATLVKNHGLVGEMNLLARRAFQEIGMAPFFLVSMVFCVIVSLFVSSIPIHKDLRPIFYCAYGVLAVKTLAVLNNLYWLYF